MLTYLITYLILIVEKQHIISLLTFTKSLSIVLHCF